MKELKLRAWEKQLKEIIPVHDIDFENKMINTKSAWRRFDEIELLQYTGLKDKNGKDIYEGDIVLMDILNVQNNKSLKITEEQRKELFKRDLKIISFQKGAFGYYPVFPDLNYFEDREWCPFLDRDGELWTDYMKVIGNIYDNPELLNEEI